MAKNKFPTTVHEPIQSFYFKLSNSMRVHAMLTPRPDSSGTQVAHVELQCAAAGNDLLMGFTSSSGSWSVTQAAQEAFRYARHEGQRVSATIVAVELEGQEFLEVADIVQIVGPGIQVSVT